MSSVKINFMNKRIIINKLFPPTPSGSYKELMIDDETMTYITTPYNSEIITAIIESHIPIDVDLQDVSILDGTACVGGDSIAFGKIFGCVVAIEIKKYTYDMLVNNLLQYELYNVIPINEDCLKIFNRLNFIDIVYFDPPWGGKDYKNNNKLRLSIGDKYVDEVVNEVLNSTKNNVKLIVLKLPKNYDLKELYDLTKYNDVNYKLYELTKMYILVIEKNKNKKNNYVLTH